MVVYTSKFLVESMEKNKLKTEFDAKNMYFGLSFFLSPLKAIKSFVLLLLQI